MTEAQDAVELARQGLPQEERMDYVASSFYSFSDKKILDLHTLVLIDMNEAVF